MIKGMKRRLWAALGALVLCAAIAPVAASAEQPANEGPVAQAGFLLTSDFSHLCLDIAAGNQGNGAALNIWTCHGGNVQRWYWNGSEIRSDSNNKCVSVAGGQNQDGAAIYMYDCHGWTTQQWYWQGRQLRSHNAHSKCLSVSGQNRWPGGTLHLWECGTHPNQGWGLS